MYWSSRSPSVQPVPNPALAHAKEAMSQLAPPPGTDPMVIQAQQEKLSAALAKIPPLVSTVPIDEELDDHQNEMNEIKTWANLPAGIKARAEKPQEFANVRLHYDEHKRALAALIAQAQAQAPPAKPVSEGLSVNFKDLPPEGQVQAAATVGIKLDLQKLMAEDQVDQLTEAAKGAKPPAMPGAGAPPALPPGPAPGGPPNPKPPPIQ